MTGEKEIKKVYDPNFVELSNRKSTDHMSVKKA